MSFTYSIRIFYSQCIQRKSEGFCISFTYSVCFRIIIQYTHYCMCIMSIKRYSVIIIAVFNLVTDEVLQIFSYCIIAAKISVSYIIQPLRKLCIKYCIIRVSLCSGCAIISGTDINLLSFIINHITAG